MIDRTLGRWPAREGTTEHDYLSSKYKLSREAAYCLCGAVLDLKISEIVDTPNWIISAYLPLGIFV